MQTNKLKMELDEKHKKFKRRVQNLYQIIKEAKEELNILRSEKCEHPESEFVTYSPRIAQYFENTEVCSVCGEVLTDFQKLFKVKTNANK